MKFLIAGLLSALAITTQALSISHLQNNPNDNCLTYSYGKTKACTQCYSRFVLKDGQCVKVSDQCREWNGTSGACTSCYDGWQLKDGACVLPDSNNGGNQLNCYYRQVPIDGKCVDVSDQCKTWDNVSGKCLSCYVGYTLDNGVCKI